MDIKSGQRLGHYEIISRIGAGGMGEVWKARDTRLDRLVAVKTISREFDERFEREAKTISQLNHPHICTLHDVGHENGTSFLVMELIEGESLADRLERGALPLPEVLRYGSQIAEALDRAHRAGIVHRDLKPGNVMITKSGAKLLDFGLAKTSEVSILPADETQQKPLTAEGTIVGTFQYMAPEQLEGQPADARTDIFALGTVLYEMATGHRAFAGKTRTSLIAAIVGGEPRPLRELQPLTPPALERLVSNCLAKDPDERWQSARDVVLELQSIADGISLTALPRPLVERRRRREMLVWSLLLLSVAVSAVLGYLYWNETKDEPAVRRSSILAPETTGFQFGGDNSGSLTLSPDGRYLTFVAPYDGIPRLWIRPLDQTQATALPGTDGAKYPFWSPDSRQIAFFADRKIKKVSPLGGAVVTITDDVRDSRGGSWGRDGTIVYSHHWRSPLYRIDSGGGKAVQLTQLDEGRKETTHRYPYFLPDGEHFLYLAGSHVAEATSGENAIYVRSLHGNEPPKLLLHARSNVIYAAEHLIFYRDGVLVAQPFDVKTLSLHGEPVRVAEGVRYEKGFFRAVFDAAHDGTLVYQRGGPQTESELIWFDRSGKEIATLTERGEFYDLRVAPDGKRVVAAVSDPPDLWVYDARGMPARLTFEPYGELAPVFSPDGMAVLFTTDRNLLYDVYRQSLTDSSDQVPLLNDPDLSEIASDWTDRYVIYDREDYSGNTQSDIWALPLEGGEPFPVVQTPAADFGGRVSPDGQWLAYFSFESGSPQIYVTSFPDGRGKWQISREGGTVPSWRSDGQELFFTQGDSVMAVAVGTEGELQVGMPVELFSAPIKSFPPPFFDPAPDGQKFLLNTLPTRTVTEPITIVSNWTAGLKR